MNFNNEISGTIPNRLIGRNVCSTLQKPEKNLISNGSSSFQRNDTLDAVFQMVLTRLGIKNCARFVAESPLDVGRRVYATKGRLYKLVLRNYECTSRLRNQSLAGEYKILAMLASCPGVPKGIDFKEYADVFVLSYELLPGMPLNLKECNLLQLGTVLWNLKNVLYALSKRGVCHNDVRACNVLVTSENRPYLIDFDQATQALFMKALLSNFIGWNNMSKTRNSFTTLIKSYVRERVPVPITAIYHKLKKSSIGRVASFRTGSFKRLPKNASERLRHMYSAWELARQSDANSPGGFICYYSLDIEGFHLPGERPWAARWAMLRDVSDMGGKRILELGCNLGLLSCHFLMEKGAKAALCVDSDVNILRAAQKVALAYKVKPRYHQADFDSSEDWESALEDFRPDIVTALSVLNWVKDKERFLTFLGRFNEVLFEGHEPEEVERDRLVRQGFKYVRLVALSERNRPVLHGRK